MYVAMVITITLLSARGSAPVISWFSVAIASQSPPGAPRSPWSCSGRP